MLNKKGSHVGIVISFIMFAVFILFFYIIIQPTVTSQNKKNLADSLNAQAKYLLSANLTEASAFVNTQPLPGCIVMNNFIADSGIGNSIIVQSNSGILTATISGNNLYINLAGNSLLNIKGSEEFSATQSGTMSNCQPAYNLGLIKGANEIFEGKIADFIQNYSTNYGLLKNQTKIPAENEFSLDFIYENGTIISTQNAQVILPASATNIYVTDTPIQYINTEGERKAGTLRIKIW